MNVLNLNVKGCAGYLINIDKPQKGYEAIKR